jgi:type IV pilus assembly protein PilM
LNILENGLPALSRDISIGGNNFTQKIAEALGIDFKAADKLKNSSDEQNPAKAIAALEAILAKLAQEARSSFDYYESRSVSSVEKIFISGGGSLYAGLKDILTNQMGLGVESWDPLKKITLAGNLDFAKVKTLSGQLAVAIGLALRFV